MALTDDTWNQHKHRPVWVRAHREELDAITGDDAERVPDAVGAVHDWVDRYGSVVSKALNAETEASDESD